MFSVIDLALTGWLISAKMRGKYFAPGGSITHDRSLVNGLDHPEIAWIGVFPGGSYAKM